MIDSLTRRIGEEKRSADLEEQLARQMGAAGPARPDIVPPLYHRSDDWGMGPQSKPRCSASQRLEAAIPGDLPFVRHDDDLSLLQQFISFQQMSRRQSFPLEGWKNT